MGGPLSMAAVLIMWSSQAMNASTTGSTRAPSDWPADWRDAWARPACELRPIQIVHGVPSGRDTPAAMAASRDAGLGGIVCNVDFSEYMTSEKHWTTLVNAVEACRDAGMVVWLYDEDGYPSGAAGGLVLQADRAFEAQALAYDGSRPDPFMIRPAYEHTHASNNFYAARRYPNLIDKAAMQCFVDKTHEAYWRRLQSHFGKTIRAFFTDEPSLMPVDLGQLGESVRKKVRVVDPLDETVKPLPSVPWCADLPAQYRQRYGEDLMPARRSLFVGGSDGDRRVRRQFWALIADLIAERYFGRIQDWCRAHRVASSGHTLWEEAVIHHVPLEGNALKVLGRMDIPGMDMLSSDPKTVLHSGWLTASLPASAALFNGGRRVMTEVSDFSQRMAKRGPTSLAQMQATAAWQAALGVTEFTSYYGSLGQIIRMPEANHGPDAKKKCRGWCDYVGRLNALLRDARLNPRVLLYYPIRDLWAEYLPVADRLTLESQSPRAQRIVRSFLRLGRKLLTTQVSFALVDHELLATAEVIDGGLTVKGHRFDAIVLPTDVELPGPIAERVGRFASAGGCVVRDGPGDATADLGPVAKVERSGRLRPACHHIVVGRFVRDGREILLIVNVGDKPYSGRIEVSGDGPWQLADPATGAVTGLKPDDAGTIAAALPGQSACLLVGPAGGAKARTALRR